MEEIAIQAAEIIAKAITAGAAAITSAIIISAVMRTLFND